MWTRLLLLTVLLLPVVSLSGEPTVPPTLQQVAPVAEQAVKEAKEAPVPPPVGKIVEQVVKEVEVQKTDAQQAPSGPTVPIAEIGPIVDQVLKQVAAQKTPMEIIWSVLPMLLAFALSFAGPYITRLGMKLGLGLSPPVQKAVSVGAGAVIAFLTGLLGSGGNINIAEASAGLGVVGGGGGHAVIQSAGIPTKAEAKADAKADAAKN